MFDFITSDKMSTSTISVFVGENRPIVGMPVWEVSRVWVCGTRTARTSEGQDGDGAERDGWTSPCGPQSLDHHVPSSPQVQIRSAEYSGLPKVLSR